MSATESSNTFERARKGLRGTIRKKETSGMKRHGQILHKEMWEGGRTRAS